MTRALSWFLVTALAFGLVTFAAWHSELWEPWLDAQGISRDDPVFRNGLKLGLVIILGLPLTALIHAIGQLGSDRSQSDIHGYKVLRLKAGSLWFKTIACLCAAVLFLGYPMLDPQAPHPWAFQAAGVFCLLCVPVFLTARVRFDDSTLSVSNALGGRSAHHWSDLADIREVPQLKHYLFIFRNGKKARISYSYAGLDDLIKTARSKIRDHAGTAEGRSGSWRA